MKRIGLRDGTSGTLSGIGSWKEYIQSILAVSKIVLRDNRDTRSRSTADNAGAVYGGECQLSTALIVTSNLEPEADLTATGASATGYWDPVRQDSSR
jgi:hypothetical protein